MKIKTAEATKLQLDWGVAKALELKPSIGRNSLSAFVQYKKAGCDFFRAVKHTDPDLCMWLIEQHGIASTRKTFSLGCFWECKVLDAGSESHYIVSHGKTLPEAVARCVVAMRLGDEFEVPDELGVQS